MNAYAALLARYCDLLREHISQPSEAHLATAAEMGRELVLSGIPPEEMAELQQAALERLMVEFPDLPLSQIALPMSAIQSEMLMAYGLVFREQLEERKRREQEILRSLREKEVLLEEIHHRVKNNLQIMSSLFSLQTRFTKDPEALKILRDSQSRIRSMALIHEKLYHSKDLEKIDFADYLKTLTNYLFHLYGAEADKVRLRLQIPPASLKMETAIPCGILVTELVSNALKHAFPAGRSGEIIIGFTIDAQGFSTLSVQDNGVGLAKKPDFKKTSTLGWHLIKTLAGQLKGRIEIAIDQGTRVSIVFPPKASREQAAE
ncbi:MAG: sensor histidine kinase [Candidatus Sericytochromatia bacterium]